MLFFVLRVAIFDSLSWSSGHIMIVCFVLNMRTIDLLHSVIQRDSVIMLLETVKRGFNLITIGVLGNYDHFNLCFISL